MSDKKLTPVSDLDELEKSIFIGYLRAYVIAVDPNGHEYLIHSARQMAAALRGELDGQEPP